MEFRKEPIVLDSITSNEMIPKGELDCDKSI
jgi:hypothetical protein